MEKPRSSIHFFSPSLTRFSQTAGRTTHTRTKRKEETSVFFFFSSSFQPMSVGGPQKRRSETAGGEWGRYTLGEMQPCFKVNYFFTHQVQVINFPERRQARRRRRAWTETLPPSSRNPPPFSFYNIHPFPSLPYKHFSINPPTFFFFFIRLFLIRPIKRIPVKAAAEWPLHPSFPVQMGFQSLLKKEKEEEENKPRLML